MDRTFFPEMLIFIGFLIQIKRSKKWVMLLARFGRPRLVRAIAVGMPVSQHPPRRSVQAAFPHTAPTSGWWRRIAYSDTDARCEAWESIAWPKTGSATTEGDGVGCDALRPGANTAQLGSESSSDFAYSQARRSSYNAPAPLVEAMLLDGEPGHDDDASRSL